MRKLEDIIQKIFRNLQSFEEQREKVIKITRDIVALSRKLINLIHSKKINEASNLLDELRNKTLYLSEEINKETRLKYAGVVRDSLKEYVEASLLFSFERNFPEKHLEFPTPENLGVTYETFLLGIIDFIGELRRVILTKLRERKYKEAWEIIDFIKNIISLLETTIFADAVIPGYKSRIDGLKRMIISTEELVLKIEHEDKLADLIDNRLNKREIRNYED